MKCISTRHHIITDTEELRKRVFELGPWWHQINMGNGICTRNIHPVSPDRLPTEYPRSLFERLHPYLPTDLSGKSVLDVGCSDGFFSIEMAKRKADRVLAIDTQPTRVRNVAFVRNQLHLCNLDSQELSVYDVPSLQEHFDLTLMLGVLYHLEDPLAGLAAIAPMTDTLILESAILVGNYGKNMAEIYLDFYDETLQLPTCEWIEHHLGIIGFTSIVKAPMSPNETRAVYICSR